MHALNIRAKATKRYKIGNRDCSTQFFILLQPAPWMDDKYVAFGQVIDGRHLLDMLEEQQTYYEAPKADIRIIDAGVLNMECHGITVSKGTNEYIQLHVEDLNELAKMLWNLLLEKLWLELEFKKIVSKPPELGEDGVQGEDQKVVHDSIRFLRSKEEVQDEADQKKGNTSDDDDDDDATNMTPEEYSYQQITPPPERAYPIALFYIPLTDVPYPGEVSSEYDLKKFLRGDYCLESDIQNADGFDGKDEQTSIYERGDKTLFTSEANLIHDDLDTPSFTPSNADEERKIKNYMQQYTDSVSFAGAVIKHIPRATAYSNVLLTKKSTSFGSHYMPPASALLSSDKSNRSKKRVEIAGMEFFGYDQLRFPMRRGQTKIRQALGDKLLRITKTDYIPISKSLMSLEVGKKHVLMRVPDEDDAQHKIQRRPTGFVHPATLDYDIDDDDDDDDDDTDDDDVTDTDDSDDDDSIYHDERPKEETKSVFNTPYYKPGRQESVRPSIFEKYDMQSIDSQQNIKGPTLKRYQPTLTEDTIRKKVLLTDYSNTLMFKHDDAPKDKFIQRKVAKNDTCELMMAAQHQKMTVRTLSSDYFRTIDQIEKKPEASIRGNEYAKRRPTLTVIEYQKLNKDKEKEQSKNKPIFRGLRMPGDSPLYLSEENIK